MSPHDDHEDGARHADAGEMARIKRQLAALEKELQSLQSRRVEEGSDEPSKMADIVWRCEKCGSKLGYYDEASEVIRIRYKEQTTWFRPGEGGSVTTVCRGCSEICNLEYVTPEERAAFLETERERVVEEVQRGRARS